MAIFFVVYRIILRGIANVKAYVTDTNTVDGLLYSAGKLGIIAQLLYGAA